MKASPPLAVEVGPDYHFMAERMKLSLSQAGVWLV